MLLNDRSASLPRAGKWLGAGVVPGRATGKSFLAFALHLLACAGTQARALRDAVTSPALYSG